MSSGVWAYDSIFNKVTSRVTDEMFTWNTHHACCGDYKTTPKTIIAVISAERVMYVCSSYCQLATAANCVFFCTRLATRCSSCKELSIGADFGEQRADDQCPGLHI